MLLQRLMLRLFLLSLSLTPALLTGCAGCADDIEQTPQGDMSALDMRAPEDMGARDLDTALDMRPAQDLSEPEDMRRTPRRDMPISQFDFGNPDMSAVPFAITSIVPPTGPLAGGTLVRIGGTSLTPGTRVLVGGVEMQVEVLGGMLSGRTPPGQLVGAVNIKAISPDGEVSELPDAFTYTTTLRVDSISPDTLPTTGGVEVVVRGAGFGEQSAVSFSGTQALRTTFVDASQLRVITPPRAAGPAHLRLTTPQGSALVEDAVTYFEPLRITRLEPATGLVAGGQQVVIHGEGFETGSLVRFDDQLVEVTQLAAQAGTLTIKTPAHAPGAVDVSVQNSREVALLQDGFTYRADDSPLLTRISPDFGSEDGGQQVFVFGYGLDEPGAQILFDTTPSMILEVSSTWARVQTPAHAPGSVDVWLRGSGGSERARQPAAFSYRPGLQLDAVTPDTGAVQGGERVVLTGKKVDQAARVWFGGLRATIVARATDTLTVQTPAHAAGRVHVRAERDGISAQLEDAYTYTEPLQVWGFVPTRGAISGQTYVSVRGAGFEGSLKARVGSTLATIVRRIDRNNLYLYTPPGAPGEVPLEIMRADERKLAPYPFLYFNPATRFGGASGSSVEGSVNVSVFATGGAPIEHAFVMLSTRPDTRYQGLTNIAGQVTLSGPEVLGSQTVTAAAAGYSTASVTSVDAENVTIFLSQTNPRPGSGSGDPPPFGIIKGEVTTPGKLSDPNSQTTYDMAIVSTTSPSPYGGNPTPGEGSVVIGQGSYNIISRIGDLSVVALCGVYDESTQSFEPQFMAVERYMVVSDQTTYEVDLDCDIPLDQELRVKLINPIYNPEGPNNNVVQVFWDFGFEGYFASPVIGEGLSSLITVPRLPALTGLLADISFTVQGGSYTGRFSPYTQTSMEDVTDTAQILSLPPLLDVPEPVSPLPGGIITNREIRWEAQGPYFPDMTVLILRNADGIPVWTITVPGSQTSVRVPEFPDFSGLPIEQRPNPYTSEQLFLTITSVRIPQFSYDAFTYEDFGSARWEAFSVSRWALSFP